jgi:hypothetical protein
MLKLSHSLLVFLSGLVWFAVGCSLLPLGLKLLVLSSQTNNEFLMNTFTSYVGNAEYVAILFIALGLFIGYTKSKYVLSKSVKRSVERIKKFPNPTSLFNIYGRVYYILLAGMIGLGASMKYLPNDVRGIIDVAVGAALINGAILYFRLAWDLRSKPIQA